MTIERIDGKAPPPKTAIVLVNWNGAADTIECLESLLRLPEDDVRIIIADNGSTDGSAEKIARWAADPAPEPYSAQPWSDIAADRRVAPTLVFRDVASREPWPGDALITFLALGDNTGFAHANNAGISLALGCGGIDYVWLLNSDTIATADALSELIARMQADATIGICGSTLVYYHRPAAVQGTGFWYSLWQCRGHQIDNMKTLDQLSPQAEVESRMTYVIGASMLVSRKFLQDVGPMSERYFLYFEEMDWALRSRGSYRLGWAPGSIVYHKEGGSIGSSTTGRPSDTSIYYMSRNLILFYARYRPFLLPVVAARLAFNAVRYAVAGDKRALAAMGRAIRAAMRPARKQSHV